MRQERTFIVNGDRYRFDRKLLKEGFYQLDSAQDAPYFGTWVNPSKLKIVEYAEGDLTTVEFDNVNEMVEWILRGHEIVEYWHIDDPKKAILINKEDLTKYLESKQ